MSEIKKSFSDYIEAESVSKEGKVQQELKDREVFLTQYPMERISTLTADEYCLGTSNSKNSLSYLMEFGKIGFGIGGGNAGKHGVYYSKKENSYMHVNEPISDIDAFWPKFREELYSFLVRSGEADDAVDLENYPLLRGMGMVLSKYLSFYYPKKYMNIGSTKVLTSALEYFEYAHNNATKSHQLNYLLNKKLKMDFPALKDADGALVGELVWDFFDGDNIKVHRSEKESGLGDEDISEIRYWLYSPGSNASKWEEFSSKGLMGIEWSELGDLSLYESRTSMQSRMQEEYDPNKSYKNDSLATWQFANEMKPGDIVYAKKGMYKIVGRGVVTSDYFYDESIDDSFVNFRHVDWKYVGEWNHPGQAVMKALTDITSYTDYISQLEKLFVDEKNEELSEIKTWPAYDKEKFLEEVYLDEKSYDTLVGLIRNKKNVILQGAPGVGKTYAANRLAYSMMGEKDKDRVMMVQFHQSYSYEDFIEGFRPSSDSAGFEIKKGSFYNFCKKAADDQENDYFFIIDEINRGNLSKILGELFMLIEKDKRGNSLQLLYSDEKFYVPKNVYIIGMMNTADRSLAMLDYALRRRFAFYEMKPAFDQKQFVEYRMGLNNIKFNNLIECVKHLNDSIKEDASLGEGFCIGHSYFCDLKIVDDDTLNSIVEYELIPLLKEYWFDEPSKVRDWSEKLRGSIK